MKLLALDGNSILNRAFYGIKVLTTKDGEFTNGIVGFLNILEKLKEETQPDAVAIAFDMRAPTFRHKKYAGYKATRKGMPEELAMQLPYAKKCAEAMGARVIELEGFEADDILGTVSRLAAESGDLAYVLTGDRDSLQLIGENTTVLLATNTDTVNFDTQRFVDTYGITPDRFVDVKALMGDSSDNIPGVPGIGEKTAFKLIAEFESLDGVYENIDSTVIKPGQRAKLAEGKDSAFLSRWLATIVKDAPIGFTADNICGYNERASEARGELCKLFTRLEFSALIKRFGLDGEPLPASESAGSAEKKVTAFDSCLDAAKAALAEENGEIYLYVNGTVSFAASLNNVYTAASNDISDAILYLTEKGVGVAVFDSKKLYADHPKLTASPSRLTRLLRLTSSTPPTTS